jgi:MFS family permease
MPSFVRTRLSAMMLIFYSSLGAWSVTAATYLRKPAADGGLNFDDHQVGWILSTFAIGGLFAHPLVGLLADRLFRADRLFVAMNALCGLFLVGAWAWCARREPVLAASSDPAELQAATDATFAGLFVILLAYSLCLQVALPLASVLSLRNLPDPVRQFSRTRLWGTVGWVAVGLTMGAVVAPVSNQPFLLAAVLAFAVGGFGLLLPPTPPRGHGKTLGEAFGLPALGLFRNRSFAVYVAGGLVLAVTNQFYAVHGHYYLTATGWPAAERWMVIGQLVEVACMFSIPLLNPKQRMKWLMLAGAVGGMVRGLVLAWGSPWAVMAVGVPMHGWQFAFYFITATTFVDRVAPPHLRASAQAIAAFVGGGVGPLLGNALAANVLEGVRTPGGIDWTVFWLWPLAGCGVAAAGFALLFRTPADPPPVVVPATPRRRPTAHEGSKVLGG